MNPNREINSPYVFPQGVLFLSQTAKIELTEGGALSLCFVAFN